MQVCKHTETLKNTAISTHVPAKYLDLLTFFCHICFIFDSVCVVIVAESFLFF